MRHEDVKITEATLRAQREERAFQVLRGRRRLPGVRGVRRRDRRARHPRRKGSDPQLPERARRLELAVRPGSTSRPDLPGNAPRVAEEAAALLRADPCPVRSDDGRPRQRADGAAGARIVGHPTELDRVYGTEAAYAGTSFLKPGDLGSLRYGSDLMNITADSTTRRGLGTFAYDDEGVPAGRQPWSRGAS
jgi:hypothetical protein